MTILQNLHIFTQPPRKDNLFENYRLRPFEFKKIIRGDFDLIKKLVNGLVKYKCQF